MIQQLTSNADRTPLLETRIPGLELHSLQPLTSSRSIAFIDRGVTDYQSLVAVMTAGTEVVVFDGAQNAITQISQALMGRSGIDNIQIFSHGTNGGLQLGNSWLNATTLPGYVNELKSWGNALTANADILLYGCNVAQDATGEAFVNLLAQATGADVAASNDLTGNAALGGDWDLEFSTGEINTASLSSLDYQYVLPIVKDINVGNGSGLVGGYNASGQLTAQQIVDVNGTLYFAAQNSTSGGELWKSDGTDAGTVLVKDIFPGISGSGVTNLTNVAGTLYFTAQNGVDGIELWKSDGTATGTMMVRDLNPEGNSVIGNMTNANGTLYFTSGSAASASGYVGGAELWKSDGTIAGTTLLKTAASFPAFYGSNGAITNITNINGTVYFSGGDSATGQELWKTDGTVAGTVLVKDIFSGTVPSPYGGGITYISSSSPSNLTNVNGTLYFTAADGTNGNELWKSDGSAAGTVLVKDIRAGSLGSDPSNFTSINNTLYFTAVDGINGRELWKSDGTATGTVLVKDIFASITTTTNGYPQTFDSSNPTNLTNVNGTLYFTAVDNLHGNELWKSDGTTAGTVLVKDLLAGAAGSNPANLKNINGKLYFTTNNNVANAVELWKSDGTSTGTTLVKDLNPTKLNFYSPALTSLNGKVYAKANDGTSGMELWTFGNAALTMSTVSAAYYSGAAPIVLDNTATLQDSNALSLDTGTLKVRFGSGGSNDDRLSIRNQGTGANQINTNGSNIYSGSTLIGSFTGGTGNTDLLITFNSSATPTIGQTLLQNITYANVSTTPSLNNRVVEFTFIDTDGDSSGIVRKTVDVSSAWQNVGIADFDRDGDQDIFRRNYVTGDHEIWLMNGTAFGSTVALPPLATPTINSLDSSFEGLADFNGDGKVDILWRNKVTGTPYYWQMNDTVFQQSVVLPTVVDLNFEVAAIADFDQDGKADILWRNKASGANVIWKMNGTAPQGVALGNVPIAWVVGGVADFDQDTKVDILWHNKVTGDNVIWKMNGVVQQQDVAIDPVSDLNFQVAGIADLDSDGKVDILWRNQLTGVNVIWKMNGFNVQSGVTLPVLIDLDLQVAALKDIDLDGKPDILWRNKRTGTNLLWKMNNTAFVAQTTFPV
jgi:ELWxxDGT repeat protein